jgi:hypothetical protein
MRLALCTSGRSLSAPPAGPVDLEPGPTGRLPRDPGAMSPQVTHNKLKEAASG